MSEQSNAAPASAPVESSAPAESNNEQNVQSQEAQSQEDSSNQSQESSGVQASTESELKKEINQAIKDGASQEEVKKMIREFTLKVNGKEFVKKVDLGDEESLKKELQLAAAGRQAMQENAELKKYYNNEIQRLRQDPSAILRDLGLDDDSIMDMYAQEINKYLEKKSKPKEDLEREERQKEFEKIKAEKEKLEKELQERERKVKMAQIEREIESDILSALESDPDLPNTPEVIAMIADNMAWAMDNQWHDVTAKDVIPTVKKELQSKFRKVAGSLKSKAALKALLGDDVLNQLREERIEQVKKAQSVNNIKATSIPKEEKPVERPKRKLSEIFE